MKQTIQTIILDAIDEINPTLESPLQTQLIDDCDIYGEKTALDSISLVTLIVNIEQKLEDKLNTTIILANEKAMSQYNSPFRNVGTLTEHAHQIMMDSGAINV